MAATKVASYYAIGNAIEQRHAISANCAKWWNRLIKAAANRSQCGVHSGFYAVYFTLDGDHDPTVLGLERGKVELMPYQPEWPQLFDAEASRLRQLLGEAIKDVEHVGSTAIPGIDSKPIIDLIASVESITAAARLIPLLEANGYEFRPDDSWSERVFLANGPRTCRTHHLTLTPMGSKFWSDHVLFRDYLRSNPAHAQAYNRLKRDLAHRFVENRRAYTEAKNEFVIQVLAAARAAF